MALHQTSGRWKLGLLLAVVTALFWASLPVTLKITLEQVDPMTLTWARFSFAAICVAVWLIPRGRLNEFRALDRSDWILLSVASIMLIGNYVFYLLGLKYTTPANAQLLIQAAPLLMALGGIYAFKEKYNLWQWLGFAAIVTGLSLFFSDQTQLPPQPGMRYVFGAGLVMIAALVWAIYAMAQKQLLTKLSSPIILLFIYSVAAVLLLPFADLSMFWNLDRLHWLTLLYCAINTVGAYGAFAEALAHWEASRVSAVLALTPLLAFASVAATHHFWPQLIHPEHIGVLGWVGAFLVIGGSSLSSLMRARSKT